MPRSSQTPQPARDELFLNLPDSLWLSRRDALLDAYRTEVLRDAIEAARDEYLNDATGDETDEAYNRGVADAIAAIDKLATGGAA